MLILSFQIWNFHSSQIYNIVHCIKTTPLLGSLGTNGGLNSGVLLYIQKEIVALVLQRKTFGERRQVCHILAIKQYFPILANKDSGFIGKGMDRHRSKCEKLTKRENNQSSPCKHHRRTHPQTRNKQLSLQTTWWDNEKIINHTYPLCTHLLTGKITETKAFTEKMVIKSNRIIGGSDYIVHGCQASVKLSIKIYMKWSRSWTSEVKVKVSDLNEVL